MREARPYALRHIVISGRHNRETWVGFSVLLWLEGGLANLTVRFPEPQRVEEQQIVFTVHFF